MRHKHFRHGQWPEHHLTVRLLLFVCILLALYAVLPQLGFFHSAWPALSSQNMHWLLAAAGVFSGTYLVAAGIYWYLTARRLRFWPMVAVQMAATFANRLLPAGVGAIGVSYEFLRHNHHSPEEAASVVIVNNALGFVGNTLLLVAILSADPVSRHLINTRIEWRYGLGVLAAVILVALAASAGRWHGWARRETGRILRALSQFGRRPLDLTLALVLSICLTLLYVLTLYMCGHAAGIRLGLPAALIVCSLGVFIGALTPVPGGLGGTEAALVAGLLAFGVSPGNALVVALTFRFITFWLALVIGALAFVWVAKRRLIIFS